MPTASLHLILHGSIVLLYGLAIGAPYGRAILKRAPAHIINAWRVAHLSLPIGAILMFATAAILPMVDAAHPIAWAIAIALIVSAYAFCVSTTLAALSGDRGLSNRSRGRGRVVYIFNAIGAGASLIAACVLVYAALLAVLRQ